MTHPPPIDYRCKRAGLAFAAAGLLEVARDRLPGARLKQGDLELLPFEDESFEVVSGLNSCALLPLMRCAVYVKVGFDRSCGAAISGSDAAVRRL